MEKKKDIVKSIKVKGNMLTFKIKDNIIVNASEFEKLRGMLHGLLISQANYNLRKIYSLEFNDLYNYHLEKLWRAVIAYKPSKNEEKLVRDSFIPFYIKLYKQQVVQLLRKYNKIRTIANYKKTDRFHKAMAIDSLLSGDTMDPTEYADKAGAYEYDITDEGLVEQPVDLATLNAKKSGFQYSKD